MASSDNDNNEKVNVNSLLGEIPHSESKKPWEVGDAEIDTSSEKKIDLNLTDIVGEKKETPSDNHIVEKKTEDFQDTTNVKSKIDNLLRNNSDEKKEEIVPEEKKEVKTEIKDKNSENTTKKEEKIDPESEEEFNTEIRDKEKKEAEEKETDKTTIKTDTSNEKTKKEVIKTTSSQEKTEEEPKKEEKKIISSETKDEINEELEALIVSELSKGTKAQHLFSFLKELGFDKDEIVFAVNHIKENKQNKSEISDKKPKNETNVEKKNAKAHNKRLYILAGILTLAIIAVAAIYYFL